MTQQPINGDQAARSRLIRIGLVAGGVVAVVALSSWCAVVAFNDDDSTQSDSGGTATSTTSASGTGTPVSQTQPPTPAKTASPGASASASASAVATAATAGQTPTQSATATTSAATAVATATLPPAATSTSVPTAAPTSTPVPTTEPTATPTTAPTATPTVAPTATPTVAQVTNFAGSWHSPVACDNVAAPWRWVVTLSQSGSQVTGSINFHDCPGLGRAEYSVTGTATSAGTIQLSAAMVFGIGNLGSSAPGVTTFTIAKLGAPSPNYAP